MKEIDEAQEIYTADARIISPASIPEDPSWPKKRLILALALVFGCGLGGSLALATEHLNRCIHTGTELRGATGLKSLVTIPALSGGRGRVAGLLGSSPKRASFYDVVVEVLEGGARS
ncbi:GNVR domain-containing protein, partial [Methyloceanibacter marginalis]|uniref:GNVR domain-containing protein n=1 Tax=Methyloceanibacter marginalis TaxID=1774971 RepID=UPI00244EB402